MAKFQVVIREVVSFVIAVEAESEAEANEQAVEILINSEDTNEFFDCVVSRNVDTTVEVDDDGNPV